MAPTSSLHLVASRSSPAIAGEDERLAAVYEALRDRLLDLTNRNPMLNARIAPDRRSRRMLQIVDVSLGAVYGALCGEEPRALDIAALPEPGDLPADELSEAFVSAFDHARLTDPDYLEVVAAIEADPIEAGTDKAGAADGDARLSEAEEALRLRLRAALGLPSRPPRHGVDRAQQARDLGINPEPALAIDAGDDPDRPLRLQTLRYPDDLSAVLDRIADSARLQFQETGMSTLFLAFGFLERPDQGTGKVFRAPLLLLPVRLVVRRVDGREVIAVAADAGIETNLSLRQLVERDFRRQLPEFEPLRQEEGAEDDAGAIARYFDAVTRAIEGLAGWQLRPWLVLGAFALGRYQLYHDLQPSNWPEPPVLNPLVRAILAGTDRPGDGGRADRPDPDDDLDSPEIEREVPHLIFEADSSQHQALVDVARGANLVIEGPPGTGKSQTITNIIAQAIGQGKKVLFLSEKQAALDVVRRKLAAVGLGAFCLELHSDSAVPKAVVEALKARAELRWGQPRTPAPEPDPRYVDARRSIERYLDGLHALEADGETPFRLIWQAIRGARGQEAIVEALAQAMPGALLRNDAAGLAAVAADIDVYALAAAEFEARHGALGASPWSRTGLKDVPAYDLLRLRAALTLWREPMRDAVSLAREAADFGVVTLQDLGALVAIEADLGAVAGGRYLEMFDEDELDEAAEALALMAEIAAFEARMAETPDLVLSPRSATVRAAELVASRFGEALTLRIPLDLARAIRGRVADAQELVAALEGLAPALAVLGLDRGGPATAFNEIALLCRGLQSMQASRLADLRAFRHIESENLANALKRRDDLVSAGSDWMRHFPGFDCLSPPRVEDIRRAATWLRQGGWSRVLASVGAAGRAERRIVQSLMGGAGARPEPGLLDQLADFVAYCDGFGRDPTFKRQFGAEWAGLATPFEAITRSIEVRRAFRHAMAQATGSAQACDALAGVDDGGMIVLIAQGAQAERFLALPTEIRARLEGMTLGAAIPQLQAEIRAADALGDLAGDPVLLSLERPLGVIAHYHHLREGLTAAQRALAAMPVASAVAARLGTGDAQAALAAIAWRAEVRSCGLADEAQALLTGPDAAGQRGRLADLAASARLVLQRLAAHAADTEADFGWFNLDDGDPVMLIERIDALIAEHGQLADYLALRRLKLELAAGDLGPFLDTAERLMVPMATLPALFRTLVARSRAEEARRNAALGATGIEMEVRRKIFAERDRARIETARAAILARLTELPELKPIPGNNVGPKAAWTELALLNTQFVRSSRFLPIRALLARAGRSIQALTPCIMASPLSLAKFMPPGKLTFDLVVIDEASQMRPEDALGGLLRAAQAVIVGDPKQSPPTDYFRRSEPDRSSGPDEDLDDESILEVAARAFSCLRRLKWHYRSRCESLIAFSNREFYGDSLMTFPTSRPEAFSIDLVRVDGIYRNRRNPDEAARIAEDAVRFMRQFGADETPPTLGIATLNIEQRDLIREELRRVSVGDALVEAYQARVAALGEPVFVKNLENLQGDERDYIMISLVRGPGPGSTAIAQSFGPLAGRSGARRLNVLITRARQGIGLYASFGSADVHPSEVSGPGVHALKRYLAYVEERGRLAAHAEGGDADSDFELEVADRLAAAGFDVAMQVGVSQYRIDLGVRHPDRPGTFLAGIECDGARYHSAKTARDRDRLREEVLRGLGWELIRVWSTDWFADPDGETRRLVRRLDLLRVVPDRSGEAYRFGLASERSGLASERSGLESERSGPSAPVGAAAPRTAVPAQLSFDLADPQATVLAQATLDESATTGTGTPEGGDALSVDATVLAETGLFGGFEEAGSAYAGPDAEEALSDAASWSLERLADALARFRDDEIGSRAPDGSRQRSILRPSLIETFVNEHVVTPADWAEKVPRYQRLGTNAAELKYLARICEIVARLG